MEKTNCRAGGLSRITDTDKYCVPVSSNKCKIIGLNPREMAREAVRSALENGNAIVAVIEKNGIKGLPVAEREVKRAERQGHKIKLIYGTRISAFDGEAADGERSMFTVILIPANKQGYRNLCELITLAYADHYTDKPAVPYEEIVSRGEGLISLDDFDSDAFELSDSGLEKIAKKIEETPLFPMVRVLPEIEGAYEALKDRCYRRAHDLYGNKLPTQVETRLSKEMDAIIGNGYASVFSIAQMMTGRAKSDGYPVGFRGSIGSSLAAFFAGITEVNPLQPHYICPNCGHYEEPQEENRIETCWELPEKCCPECGSKMRRDGYDIPPETLFGYRMDREPDIDLNFAPEYRDGVHQLLVDHFGADRVVTPGICRSDGKTGYHPWGAFIVPENYKITDFTPLQKQTLNPDEDKLVTHIDYHDVDYPLLKVDMLEHKGLHMLKVLEEETGILAEDIPLEDKDTLEYLTYAEGDISESDMNEYDNLVEFGSGFARQVIHAASPHSFADLVRANGLIHGTDAWDENAELHIADGTARLRDVITTRDDIMNYMLELGMDRENAYKIMDTVWKGRTLKPVQTKLMRDHGVPEWYIESCGKVVYVFPRAHAVVYTMMAFRLAWYKVHCPEAYAKLMLSNDGNQFGAHTMSILKYIEQIDWTSDTDRKIVETVYSDACEYWSRVIDHIYKGNEIRADMWMDFSEKQEEIKKLDRKRTEAHNKLLISATDLIDMLEKSSDFRRTDYHLDNRTQIADCIAGIAFEMLDMEPTSAVEGSVRDELAEKIHNGKVTKKMIVDRAESMLSIQLLI